MAIQINMKTMNESAKTEKDFISIVICTYNRADILQQTLESFFSLNSLDNNFELIVVDNNSTDTTREIVEYFVDQNPQVLYRFEKKPGLSQARNTGIKEAKGEIVAFVDDDVFFDKEWYINLRDIFWEKS